jgi:hypothetical protein
VTTSATEPKCEYCDKVGLPILPVRYGVADSGVGAPKTTVPTIALADKAAQYTYRLARSGYIYVYDEARDTWGCYFVTPESYLFRIDHRPSVTPVLPANPFNCASQGHRAIASCIMIRWTNDVLTKHKDANYRKRHMRIIDIKSGVAGPDSRHMFSIKEVDAKVAEYHMADAKLRTALNRSAQVPSPRKSDSEKLKSECERLKPGKGLVVALADPVGVAQDLALLMHHNKELLLNEKKIRRHLAVHSTIEAMQSAIKQNSEKAEIKAAERMANEQIGNNPLGHAFFESTRKQTEEIRNVNSQELERAAQHGWSKYKKKYDFAAADQWKKRFDVQLQKFDAGFIAPLAIAHSQWMQHDAMKSYFECNYDRNSIQSGEVYTAVFNLCIASTSDKKACHDLYEKWLLEPTGTANLLKNALAFNQQVR